MPVLSRFYSAESFGVLGTFLSIASILSSLATLQYGVALMLPKRDTEAANVFILGGLSVACITVIITIFLAIFPDLSLALTKAPENTFTLMLLPLYVLFNGTNQMLVGWSVRRSQFRQNSISQVVRSLTVNSVQIAAAPVLPFGGTLATGAMLGEFGSSVNLGYVFWKTERRFFQRCFSTSWMKHLAKSYYDFPAFSTPQYLLNAVSQGLPILLLGHYFGIEVAGLYAFGIRLVQAPMNLLLTPLRQVLFQKLCEVQNQGIRIMPIYRKSTLGLLAVIILPMIAGIVFFPALFAFIFGENWRRAGEFGRWLLVWHAVGFCNVPSVLMGRILRMQRQMLLFDGATLGLRTIILVIGGIYWNDMQSVAAFGVLGAVLNMLLIGWIWKRIQHEELSIPHIPDRIELA
jgi:O-antigen/teichoic acid export membrane protein